MKSMTIEGLSPESVTVSPSKKQVHGSQICRDAYHVNANILTADNKRLY